MSTKKKYLQLNNLRQLFDQWNRPQCMAGLESLAGAAYQHYGITPCVSHVDSFMRQHAIEMVLKDAHFCVDKLDYSHRYLANASMEELTLLLSKEHCKHCKVGIRPILYFAQASVDPDLKRIKVRMLRSFNETRLLLKENTTLYNDEYFVMLIDKINENALIRATSVFI